MVSGKKETIMSELEIKKARLAAIRLAAGISDESIKIQARGPQAPDGAREEDYRFRKFSRRHRLVA